MSIFENLIIEYNEKKQRAEAIAKQNYEKALLNGEFLDIENRLRRLVIDSARESLKTKGKNKFDIEIENLEKLMAQLLQRLKIKSIKPQYSCKICCDTGFVNNSPCKCFKLRINELISNECGLSLPALNKFEDFNEKLFEEKEKQNAIKTKEMFTKYCDSFPDNKKLNLILSGKTGCGKTFLAACIASKIIERGFTVIFSSAFSLNNAFLKYQISETKFLFLNALSSADLLIIDDLGCENLYNNVTNEYFLAVINERNSHNKATIITTNLTAKEIEENYKDRFASRLLDKKAGHFVRFNNGDIRLVN